MQKNNINTFKLALILVAIAAVLSVAYAYLSGWLTLQSTKSVTRYEVITFNVVPGWKVYHKNQDYDIDFGYFQKGEKGEVVVCKINTITANLNREPSFEQFMGTTLGGKMFIDSHSDIKFKNQDAWRGSYTFPAQGIVDPAQNDRLLFRYKTLYVDITLSYNTSVNEATKLQCNTDFQMFLDKISLL